MVHLRGVSIDCGRGLGAEVAHSCVEVQGADAVPTDGAGELHAALDALDSIGFHYLNPIPMQAGSQDPMVGQRT